MVPVRVASPSTDVPTTRVSVRATGPASTRASGPSWDTDRTTDTSGTEAPADPEPRTDARGGTATSSPSCSMYICAWVPPVRMAVASVAAQTGSPQPSYTQRGPSTECSAVPMSDPSAASSGPAR